jgi:predicted nucleotidyltransferase
MAKKKAEIIRLVKQYLKEAESVCPVDKAVLFGSYAHGKAKKESDIDIAIFSRKVTDKNRLETMSRLIMLIAKLKLDIQPVVFPYADYLSGENDFISEEIKKKGLEVSFQ